MIVSHVENKDFINYGDGHPMHLYLSETIALISKHNLIGYEINHELDYSTLRIDGIECKSYDAFTWLVDSLVTVAKAHDCLYIEVIEEIDRRTQSWLSRYGFFDMDLIEKIIARIENEPEPEKSLNRHFALLIDKDDEEA